jgi:hypothetical protein
VGGEGSDVGGGCGEGGRVAFAVAGELFESELGGEIVKSISTAQRKIHWPLRLVGSGSPE